MNQRPQPYSIALQDRAGLRETLPVCHAPAGTPHFPCLAYSQGAVITLDPCTLRAKAYTADFMPQAALS